jgi:xanthine dehydrogenase accessory factor
VLRPLPPNLFETLAGWIDGGRKFALVTVLRASGSTPRKAGTRAVIDESGAILGTIGGGPLESQARRVGMEMMRTGRTGVFDFKFSGPSAAENLPICGGEMRVLVDATAERSRTAYAAAGAALRERRRGVLMTRIETEGDRVDVSVEFREAHTKGEGAEVIRAALADNPGEWKPEESPGGAELLIEPVVPPPRLLVVGGGHVGQAVAQHAALVGFEIVLFEDRAEFADPALLPPGTVVKGGDVGESLAEFETDGETYIAMVSRGHVTDSKALAAVIKKPAAYLGMMGSRRKIDLVRTHFIETGLASEGDLERLRAPIGLEIGAQTVPEIAASVVAELIAVRRGRADYTGEAQ